MKRYFIFLVLLFLCNTIVFSQNWPVIRNDLVYYFRESSILPSPNSIATFTDTVYKVGDDSLSLIRKSPNRFQFNFGNCLSMENIFLGPKFIVRSKSIYFFNEQLDSIRINIDEDNPTSLVYKNDSLKYALISTIESVSEELVLGEFDSVLKVKFIVLNFSGDTIKNHPLTKMGLKFSKTFGLIETPSWNDFPFYTTNPNSHNLIGLFEKNGLFRKGVINKYDDHNFEHKVGDEIHEVYENISWLQTGISVEFETINKKLLIISRDTFLGNIGYTANREMETISGIRYVDINKPDEIKREFIKDKIGIMVNYNELVYPYTLKALYPVIIGNDLNSFSFNSNLQKWTHTDNNYMRIGEMYFRDSCWFDYPEPNYYYRSTFYDSIGGPYYHHTLLSGGLISNQLVYFKSGNIKYGIPIGLNHVEKTLSINVYPNPANEYLNIENGLNQTCQFELRNMSSQLVLSKEILGTEQIYISNLDDGIYFYKISFKNQSLHQFGKLFVSKR